MVTSTIHKLLAKTFSVYLKTLNYHWNIEGAHFSALHKLFQEQYEELAQAIDEIAEHLSSKGMKVDATMQGFASISEMPEPNSSYGWHEMVCDLRDSHAHISKYLEAAIIECQEAGDEASCDLCVQRLREHNKVCWMLTASAK